MEPFYLGIYLHLKRTYLLQMYAKKNKFVESPSQFWVQGGCDADDIKWTQLNV